MLHKEYVIHLEEKWTKLFSLGMCLSFLFFFFYKYKRRRRFCRTARLRYYFVIFEPLVVV